jgi:hypothetical protein
MVAAILHFDKSAGALAIAVGEGRRGFLHAHDVGDEQLVGC